jgi:hypothetical protein
MGKTYIELSYFQVSLAAVLIVINGAISIMCVLMQGIPEQPAAAPSWAIFSTRTER